MQVAKMAIPLILGVASSNLMLFADRLMLAHFSIEAMNAAVAMGMTATLFHFGAISIVSITEVFVGRFNGSGQLHRCGPAAYQMIYFSLMTIILFAPLAWLGPRWLAPTYVHAAGGHDYFRVLMLCGPLFPAVATLSSYFVGLRKVRAVTIAMVTASGLNVLLDLLFIPHLGCKGAALASVIAQGSQLTILGALFLRRHQRRNYSTNKARFDPGLCWDLIRIGTPSATSHMIEIACWTIGIQMLTHAGPRHLGIYAVGNSFFLLFSCLTEGLHKGMTSLASNCIGSKDMDAVRRILRSGLLLVAAICAMLALPLLIFPQQLTHLFLAGNDSLNLLTLAPIACGGLWLFFLLDGAVWAFASILTAGGDTKFLMWTNGLSAIFATLIPGYFAYIVFSLSPAIVWALPVAYGFVNCTCLYLRVRSGQWQTQVIT